jgi:hypothetical protein
MLRKLSMSKGALTWFETLWSYNVEAIDYWIIFSMKTKSNRNWKTVLEFSGRSWCCWKAPWRWVRFNRVYFIIFKAKVWKILIFEWILLLKIQTNCKNWVWKEKSVESSMCSHLGRFNVFTLGPTT